MSGCWDLNPNHTVTYQMAVWKTMETRILLSLVMILIKLFYLTHGLGLKTTLVRWGKHMIIFNCINFKDKVPCCGFIKLVPIIIMDTFIGRGPTCIYSNASWRRVQYLTLNPFETQSGFYISKTSMLLGNHAARLFELVRCFLERLCE